MIQRLDGLASITTARLDRLIPLPPLAGPRPIVGWVLKTFRNPLQIGAQGIMFSFCSRVNQGDIVTSRTQMLSGVAGDSRRS